MIRAYYKCSYDVQGGSHMECYYKCVAQVRLFKDHVSVRTSFLSVRLRAIKAVECWGVTFKSKYSRTKETKNIHQIDMKLNKELSGAEECLFHLNEELLERNLYSGDVLKIQFSLKLLKIMLDLRG